jgi:hypothetical protein
MTDKINCKDGIAHISLCRNNTDILVCGSLVNASYWTLPSFKILTMGEFKIQPNNEDCKDNNIINYMLECELKVDIISSNSIYLRLYKKDFEDDDEGTTIGFSINTEELLKIAQCVLYNIHNK